ncbi:MAG: cob(I)yrinic acid a,c-diamide adenosyltransferase [Ignavibacteria bacterium]|nr:cob(I)yrinic acid a,c-diamide adenosyltransferase [Ignavibacteria bacterium]
MKIYTKTGDDGTTGLFNGKRVSKAALRVEAYGTVDELNTVVGLAYSFECPEPVKSELKHIMNILFTVGADLATPIDQYIKSQAIERTSEVEITRLEEAIDRYDEDLKPLKNFILPGGHHSAAFLHNARTVCRRAERLTVELASTEKINDNIIKYLNRLSDYFFAAARYVNHLTGVEDVIWKGN